MSKLIKCLLLMWCAAIATGCSNDEGENLSVDKTKPYNGRSIDVIVPKLHGRLISGPILEEAKLFSEQTGATIRVVTPGWSETIKKIEQSVTDTELNYDIYVVVSMWNGTLFGSDQIEPIPDAIKKRIDWDDVLPIYRNTVLSWGGKGYGLPYDGDSVNLYYRKDLFENIEYREKFKKQFGYDLSVPKTWSSFKDVAQFFTGWDWDGDGEIEYGLAGSRVRGDLSMLKFFASAGAFSKHPDDKAYYFDPETLKPRINNPGFVKALETYVELLKFGPPGMNKFASHDIRNNFISGKVAMVIDWADTGTYATNSPISIIRDKVGYAQLPASNRVYNSKTGEWENRKNQASSISGNWMFLISKSSKNQDLAFDFAAHMTSKELTKNLTALSGNGVNPSRYSHFNDPESWQQSGFSTQSAKAYLDEIKISLANDNVTYDINIPGAAKYYSVVDNYAYEAILGKMTAQQAMNKTAKEWEQITDSYGREKQVNYYQSSLNLR